MIETSSSSPRDDKEETAALLNACAEGAAMGMAFGPGGIIPGMVLKAAIHLYGEKKDPPANPDDRNNYSAHVE
jgi:hypothetical protein